MVDMCGPDAIRMWNRVPWGRRINQVHLGQKNILTGPPPLPPPPRQKPLSRHACMRDRWQVRSQGPTPKPSLWPRQYCATKMHHLQIYQDARINLVIHKTDRTSGETWKCNTKKGIPSCPPPLLLDVPILLVLLHCQSVQGISSRLDGLRWQIRTFSSGFHFRLLYEYQGGTLMELPIVTDQIGFVLQLKICT